MRHLGNLGIPESRNFLIDSVYIGYFANSITLQIT